MLRLRLDFKRAGLTLALVLMALPPLPVGLVGPCARQMGLWIVLPALLATFSVWVAPHLVSKYALHAHHKPAVRRLRHLVSPVLARYNARCRHRDTMWLTSL